MPWDLGRVPPALDRYLAGHPGRGATVLIPGCGSGYEIAAFSKAGYGVTAIDFSAVAVAQARELVGAPDGARIIEGDFFTHDFAAAPFDLVYERTFLCALPVDLWPKIVERTASLLRPGGILAGLYFFGEKEDGPPFGLAPGEAAGLFDGRFILVHDEPVPETESPRLFAGSEHWQERRRRI